MTRIVLTLPVLLLVVSCSYTVKIQDTPLNEINSQLSLNWLPTETNPMAGFYTIDGDNVPDGPFSLSSVTRQPHKSDTSGELFSLNVTGFFEEGRKTGEWRYDYQYDNGNVLYENYRMTMRYENDTCTESSFRGVIGRNMPIQEHRFYQKAVCNPMQLRERIMDLWDEGPQTDNQGGLLPYTGEIR